MESINYTKQMFRKAPGFRVTSETIRQPSGQGWPMSERNELKSVKQVLHNSIQ